MPSMSNLLRSLCLLALTAHLTLAQAATAQPRDPVVTALMTRAMANLPGQEVLMLIVVYPPGGFDPVHRHDAHGFIYVLEGSIVMGVQGGKAVTLHPGDTFYEGPEDVHTVGRNASQTEPAKFLVVLVKDAHKPAVLPVAGQ